MTKLYTAWLVIIIFNHHERTESTLLVEDDKKSHSHDVLPTEEGILINDEVKVSVFILLLHQDGPTTTP